MIATGSRDGPPARADCTRSCANQIAFCVAPSAICTPCRPTFSRALFIIVNIARIPPNSGPINSPMQSPSSPKANTQVGEALIPILCSMETVWISCSAPGRPIRIQPVFGNEKQRNPLGPRRRIGRAGEHEVDDIVRHVMIAES